MQWFLTSFGGLGAWIVKKSVGALGIKTFIIVVYLPLCVLFISGVIFVFDKSISYIIKIWNLFKQLSTNFFNYGGGGSFGGLSNSTITSSAMEFLYQSGLADAFINSMDLFISILVFYFTLQLGRLMVWAYNSFGVIVSTLLTFMSK